MSSSGVYDYIVVGGGTAGLVVAARLSENPDVTVCVVEAGKDHSTNVDTMIPGFAFKNMGNPEVDWMFFTAPQPHLNGRQMMINRGKGLGGSSIVSIYARRIFHFVDIYGNAKEYDAFESLGSPGWNWESFLKYFKKSETFTASSEELSNICINPDSSAHGSEGPLHISVPRWISDTAAPFRSTLESSFGIKRIADGCSGENTGIQGAYQSIHPTEAVRSSSASAYLQPNKARSNLHVITGAHVTRVLFNSEKHEDKLVASGIEYAKDGKTYTVATRKEVIICGGTIQTPQVLELSGIGNKSILEANGVVCRHHLPGVGQNLQDHFWVPYIKEMDSKIDSFEILMSDPARAGQEWMLYQESKLGMLSSFPSASFAYVPVSTFSDEETYVKGVESLTPTGPAESKTIQKQKEWIKSNVPHLEFAPFPGCLPAPGAVPQPGKRYYSFFVGLLHPFSRGSVHIGSPDAFASPVIDQRALDNEVDIEMMLDAIKFVRKVGETGPLGAIGRNELLPGAEVQTDDQLREWIKNSSMLPLEDGGVVDATLKVYGTANLRVVDASVMPIHISAHTQATVYAIAEKAADIIRS
ncbi:alcohol oxidase [Amanita rubescens]|nr:alcohol oxidase [Amanita rubescens]